MEHSEKVYVKWLVEDKSKPIKAVHFLYEYLYTPNENDNKLTIEEELSILEKFCKEKRRELNDKIKKTY